MAKWLTSLDLIPILTASQLLLIYASCWLLQQLYFSSQAITPTKDVTWCLPGGGGLSHGLGTFTGGTCFSLESMDNHQRGGTAKAKGLWKEQQHSMIALRRRSGSNSLLEFSCFVSICGFLWNFISGREIQKTQRGKKWSKKTI